MLAHVQKVNTLFHTNNNNNNNNDNDNNNNHHNATLLVHGIEDIHFTRR